MTATPTPAMTPTASPDRIARRALGFAITGIVLSLIGPVLDTIGASAGNQTATTFIVGAGIAVQAAGIAFALGGLIAGIIALVRRVRPITRPLLAILAIPIGGILLLVEIFVIFLATS